MKKGPHQGFSLQAVALAPAVTEQPATVADAAPERPRTKAASAKKSKATTIYLHPKGHQALMMHKAEAGNGITMLDMVHEALEMWARTKGIKAPFRPE